MFLDRMGSVAGWLAARADFVDPNGSGQVPGGGSGVGGGGGVQVTVPPTRNTTGFGGFAAASSNNTAGMNFMAFNALRFAGAKSVRTSTIILAVFNVIAAFGVVLGILYDCYKSYKRSHPKFKFR